MTATATQVEVKERPILFSGPMVRAILESRKTQTRRVIKPQPETEYDENWAGGGYLKFRGGKLALDPIAATGEEFCPYGKRADRLWVRETWAPHDDGVMANHDREFIYYRADDETKYETDGAWRPSIFMPRWASRTMLEITSIGIERLQEISLLDVEAEGFPRESFNGSGVMGIAQKRAQRVFAEGWDKLNAKRGYSWESNPWVWVIEFKKL